MAATIKDIAEKTGLGLATISSFINGGNVRVYNRVKIEEAIKELNYEVNEVARGLKTSKSKMIGVIIPELNNIFSTEIIIGIEDVLRSHGYATIVCDCRTDKRLEREAAEFLYRRRVDGIITIPVSQTSEHLKVFEEAKKPIILIDRIIEDLKCDSVLVDNRLAIKEALHELIIKGHRKIGFISGPKDIFTAKERLAGYAQGLEEAGISMNKKLIDYGDYTILGGVQGVKSLTYRNPEMTAFIVSNYEMTMGAVIAMNELGIKVPDDLSMIGFDNISFARACKPMLSIVTQPSGEIAINVAEIMLKRLKEDETEIHNCCKNIKLRTQIVFGQSIKLL